MFDGAIKNATQVTVVVLTLCVIGIMCALRLPVGMIPDLEVRTITVETAWPGATPQDVEKEILIQQEDYLRTLSGLQRIISTASMGEAVIELDFPFGTDITEALIKVNNALSQVPSYPENVDEPRLYATSFSSNFFMFFRIFSNRATETPFFVTAARHVFRSQEHESRYSDQPDRWSYYWTATITDYIFETLNIS